MSQTTILIIDDSSLSRMMIKNYVGEVCPSWLIVEAKNGSEALEKCKGSDFNWVTIDFNMPGISGLALVEKLKIELPNARMTLLTANIQDTIRTSAEKLDVGFIQKPITKEKIRNYVKG